jgi:retron-type reverse transcriptase
VLNLDVEGFFPSIHKGRLKVLLRSDPVSYSSQLARFIATICTKDGVLPQGSPASPLLTNLACVRLDKKLSIVAVQFGAKYTRYADDITFSGSSKAMLNRLIVVVTKVLKSEGLKVHPTKTRLLPSSQRQEVTGLSVHDFVNVPRTYRRRIRSALHHWEAFGHVVASEKLGYASPENYVQSIGGQIEFVIHSMTFDGRSSSNEVAGLKEKYNRLMNEL